jgi:hypothetical protein
MDCGHCRLDGIVRLIPSVFHGNTVVSMRPYKPEDVERVRDITRPYLEAHGEPIAWVCRSDTVIIDGLQGIGSRGSRKVGHSRHQQTRIWRGAGLPRRRSARFLGLWSDTPTRSDV